MIGLDGLIRQANAALAEMLGYEDVRGMTIGSLLHPGDVEMAREQVQWLQTGALQRIAGEFRYLHRDGHEVHAEVRASAVGAGDSRYLIAQYVDVSDRKRFESQLRRLADHDALTGLFNRRRFGEELEWLVGYAQRYGQAAAVLAIDVDHFHYINDNYGHATGDELLGAVASAAAVAPARDRRDRPARRRRVRRDPAADRARGRRDDRALAGGERQRPGPDRARRPQGTRHAVDRHPGDRPGDATHPRRAARGGRDRAQRGQGARARPVRRRRTWRRRRRLGALTRAELGRAAARGARSRRLRALRAADPGPGRRARSIARSC